MCSPCSSTLTDVHLWRIRFVGLWMGYLMIEGRWNSFRSRVLVGGALELTLV